MKWWYVVTVQCGSFKKLIPFSFFSIFKDFLHFGVVVIFIQVLIIKVLIEVGSVGEMVVLGTQWTHQVFNERIMISSNVLIDGVTSGVVVPSSTGSVEVEEAGVDRAERTSVGVVLVLERVE